MLMEKSWLQGKDSGYEWRAVNGISSLRNREGHNSNSEQTSPSQLDS